MSQPHVQINRAVENAAISQGGLEKAMVMAGLWTAMQLPGGDTSVSMEGKELKPESGHWKQQTDQRAHYFGVCWCFSTELKRDDFPVAATSLWEYGGAISLHCCPLHLHFFCPCPQHQEKHLSILLWASQVAIAVKTPPTNAEDMRDVGSIPGSGRYLQKEPTWVLLLGKSYGEKILVGYSP